MLVDQRVGSAELERLAMQLRPPCALGGYALEGVLARTSTALIFAARDAAGAECVLKLTGRAYMPVLQRELDLLNACGSAHLDGIVHPLQDALLQVGDAAAIVLPFLSGGDLVQWIGGHATRTFRLGAAPALQIGDIVAHRALDLLRLPEPIVHGDVKPQNVLLPRPEAPLRELTLIDLDAATQLEPHALLRTPPRDIEQLLVGDVNGFGELLYMLATGREPPAEDEPTPMTGNPVFNALVVRCITAEPGERGYASMAGDALWRDLAAARKFERRRERNRVFRPVLALLGLALFCVLVVAVLSKLS